MASRFNWLAILIYLAISALALPLDSESHAVLLKPRGGEGQPFQCPNPLATKAAKEKLIKFGAKSIDLAIAMLENGCDFKANFAAGNGKSNDNAELGLYRNNWYMIRTYCDDFKGLGEYDWSSHGQQIHNDRHKATKCQRQLWNTLGANKYYALQRGGLSNMDAGRTYGQYVRKYDAFMRKGKNMHNGMGIYWNIASM